MPDVLVNKKMLRYKHSRSITEASVVQCVHIKEGLCVFEHATIRDNAVVFGYWSCHSQIYFKS